MSNDDQLKCIGSLVIRHSEQRCRVVCVQEKRKKLIAGLRRTQELLGQDGSIMMVKADNDTLTIDRCSLPETEGVFTVTANPSSLGTSIEYPGFAELQEFISEYQEAVRALDEVENQLKEINPGLFNKARK